GRFLKPDNLTPDLLRYLKDLNEQAKQRGQTLAEMAISWILEQQGVTSVIVGASSTNQLAKNLESIR
ncbi:MAG: aldo/keto reductase, partial [Prevotella sp.]|nr:aldo/keto reductase [Prevotella sp.]